eukprot:Gb_19817 [translate_table: standard]
MQGYAHLVQTLLSLSNLLVETKPHHVIQTGREYQYSFAQAEKQLKLMQQVDEDHTLTQLANAWINLAVGGAKVQEAYLIFQDFCDKYQLTVPILNGKAICCMHMGRFDEAESVLLEALNKDAKDADTLANLVVCNLHLGKPATRYLSQLKLSHPEHILIKRASGAEESFDRAVQAVA